MKKQNSLWKPWNMVQMEFYYVLDNISTIKKVAEFIDKIESEKFSLVLATITRVEPVGSGDRVCVDTCSIMKLEKEC